MTGQTLKGHLDLLILACLECGPQHGYAVIEALAERSGGAFELPEGTVYPVLHRLEKAKLLASRWVMHEGRRRRVYRLTRSGRSALACREQEWHQFSAAVVAVLGASA